MTLPILYTFRRCPYAMRARMALKYAGTRVELREVILRQKPPEMLEASVKGTVPILVTQAGVLDESLDIMLWALSQNDPGAWISPDPGIKTDTLALIHRNDFEFKPHLDGYKYSDPKDPAKQQAHRQQGELFFSELEDMLTSNNSQSYFFGKHATLADVAILPFIRQFAHVDIDWFTNSRYSALRQWLNNGLSQPLFLESMHKYPAWQAGDLARLFP